MSLRIVGIAVMLATLSLWIPASAAEFVSSVDATKDATLPQNFQVSELREGPGRFQVALVYQWDAATKAGTSAYQKKYELNKACTYKFSGLDKAIGGNSGLVIMEGPGPKYRVEAICNCSRYTYITPLVRAYAASA